jgi:hypothetical protein
MQFSVKLLHNMFPALSFPPYFFPPTPSGHYFPPTLSHHIFSRQPLPAIISRQPFPAIISRHLCLLNL